MRNSAKLPIVFALLHAGIASAYEWKAGYELAASQAGYAHLLAAAKAAEYYEVGLQLGYGVSPLVVLTERVTPPTPSAGASWSRVMRSFPSQALKVNIPVKAKYRKWPYLLGEFSYERILKTDSRLQSTGVSGFSRSNDIFLYPGVGYELAFRERVAVHLTMLTRFILTDPDKAKYYRIPAEAADPPTTTRIDPTLGSRVFFNAGIDLLF